MSINPFSDFVKIIREQGAENNEPGIEIAEVLSSNPIKLLLNGTELSEEIKPLSKVTFSVGDQVAIFRVGEEVTIIIGNLRKAPADSIWLTTDFNVITDISNSKMLVIEDVSLFISKYSGSDAKMAITKIRSWQND